MIAHGAWPPAPLRADRSTPPATRSCWLATPVVWPLIAPRRQTPAAMLVSAALWSAVRGCTRCATGRLTAPAGRPRADLRGVFAGLVACQGDCPRGEAPQRTGAALKQNDSRDGQAPSNRERTAGPLMTHKALGSSAASMPRCRRASHHLALLRSTLWRCRLRGLAGGACSTWTVSRETRHHRRGIAAVSEAARAHALHRDLLDHLDLDHARGESRVRELGMRCWPSDDGRVAPQRVRGDRGAYRLLPGHMALEGARFCRWPSDRHRGRLEDLAMRSSPAASLDRRTTRGQYAVLFRHRQHRAAPIGQGRPPVDGAKSSAPIR